MNTFQIVLLSLCALNACVSSILGITKLVCFIKYKKKVAGSIKEQAELKKFLELKEKYEK